MEHAGDAMTSKPIVAPVKGDPLRASWGAAVAERTNECAAAIDAMRGPGGISSLREPKGVAKDGLFPFLVRFVPDPEGDGTDGVLIIYIPPGSLTVNGTAAEQEVYPLAPYTEGDYSDKEHWFELFNNVNEYTVWLDFEFNVEDGEFGGLGFGDAPEDAEDDHSVIKRSVALASIDITPADGDTRGRVTVNQITKGPLAYEVGVQSLNGMVGHLNVKASEQGLNVEGKTLYADVSTDHEDGSIVIGLTDEEPDEDEDEGSGYCNDISGGEGMGGNDNSGGGGIGNGISEELGDTGNDISDWPCKKGDET